MTVFDRVAEEIAEIAGVDKSKVKIDASLKDDLDMDSLDQTLLMIALEEEFGQEIDDQTAETLTTVGQIVEFIEEKLGEAE